MNREILKYDHPGIIHEALTALNENAFMPQDDDDLNNRTDSPWRSMPDRILITTPAPQLDRELRKALRTGSQASIRSAYRKVAEVELVIRTVSQERPLEGLLEEIMEVRQRLSGCNVTEWIRNLQEIREQTIREQTARDQPSALTEHVMHQLEKACRDMNDFVVLDGEGARQTAKQSMRIGTSLAVIDRHIWSQTGA